MVAGVFLGRGGTLTAKGLLFDQGNINSAV